MAAETFISSHGGEEVMRMEDHLRSIDGDGIRSRRCRELSDTKRRQASNLILAEKVEANREIHTLSSTPSQNFQLTTIWQNESVTLMVSLLLLLLQCRARKPNLLRQLYPPKVPQSKSSRGPTTESSTASQQLYLLIAKPNSPTHSSSMPTNLPSAASLSRNPPHQSQSKPKKSYSHPEAPTSE